MLGVVKLDLEALFRPAERGNERLAADARGRRRRDGRDEPPAGDAGRAAALDVAATPSTLHSPRPRC